MGLISSVTKSYEDQHVSVCVWVGRVGVFYAIGDFWRFAIFYCLLLPAISMQISTTPRSDV